MCLIPILLWVLVLVRRLVATLARVGIVEMLRYIVGLQNRLSDTRLTARVVGLGPRRENELMRAGLPLPNTMFPARKENFFLNSGVALLREVRLKSIAPERFGQITTFLQTLRERLTNRMIDFPGR